MDAARHLSSTLPGVWLPQSHGWDSWQHRAFGTLQWFLFVTTHCLVFYFTAPSFCSFAMPWHGLLHGTEALRCVPAQHGLSTAHAPSGHPSPSVGHLCLVLGGNTHMSWSLRDLPALARVAYGSQSLRGISAPACMGHCLSGVPAPAWATYRQHTFRHVPAVPRVTHSCSPSGLSLLWRMGLLQAVVSLDFLCAGIVPLKMAIPRGFFLRCGVLSFKSASPVMSPTMSPTACLLCFISPFS